MRTVPRYYLVGDDGEILRLAQKTFFRILEQRITTPFPQLKGHRVKLATLQVQLDGKRPVAVMKATYNFITFDDNGILDSTEWDQSFEQTIATWAIPSIPKQPTVIDARARFTDRRHHHELTWDPTDELRDALFAKATGHRHTSH
ncbi:MAG: hypothetical protein ABI779_19085 [Acidobacteriota bacterium]